ncbi:MAG: hypothetical protein QOJ62_2373 [Actinomycetota bacterium]|nr:hypothetical protein [Actinomycetota bacterium]
MGIDAWEKAAEKADELVPPADELGNAVLVDDHRLVRLAGPLFTALSLCLIPWIGYVAVSLPERELSPNYDVAWAGFDVMLLAALASTAYFAFRRSRHLAVAAASAGTLLIVDAWFDVLTSSATQTVVSVLLAVFIELPLAALCWWLSGQTQAIAERRIALLLPRTRSRHRT